MLSPCLYILKHYRSIHLKVISSSQFSGVSNLTPLDGREPMLLFHIQYTVNIWSSHKSKFSLHAAEWKISVVYFKVRIIPLSQRFLTAPRVLALWVRITCNSQWPDTTVTTGYYTGSSFHGNDKPGFLIVNLDSLSSLRHWWFCFLSEEPKEKQKEHIFLNNL